MESELKKTKKRRNNRVLRVRKPLVRSDRPRLVVNRSLKKIYAQLIDDRKSVTIAAISTQNKELKDIKNKCERAKKAGIALANAAKEKGVKKVVFDRRHNKYHGRIAAFAEGAREAGLVF